VSKQHSRVICLDADGVLLDYTAAYGQAWERAFGTQPTVANPQAYWPWDYWGVGRLSGETLNCFRSVMDEEFWSTIPLIDGVAQACRKLQDASFTLVCVSAIESKFQPARVTNLRDFGIPMPVIATGRDGNGKLSSKAAAISTMPIAPVAFVDDYLPYFEGIPPTVHKALIQRGLFGTPNVGPGLKAIHSTHSNLLEFANFWTRDLTPSL
jgi:hypothetical protein